MRKKILFYNQLQLIGGGEKTADLYIKQLKKIGASVNSYNEHLTISLLRSLLINKQQYFINSYYLPAWENIVINLCARLSHDTTITICHGLWFKETQADPNHSSFVKIAYAYIHQWVIFLTSTKIIIFSEYQQKMFKKYFPYFMNKVVIIPPGITIGKHTDEKKNKRVTSFLIISRLERRKGIHLALEALSQLISQHSFNVYFVFPTDNTADWNYFSQLLSIISMKGLADRVKLVTGVSFERTKYYYTLADVFIMSSIEQETFGWTTLEALSSGCLVVGFKENATPELLGEDLSKILLTESISIADLAKVLKMVIRLPPKHILKLRNKCRERSRLFSMIRFNQNLKRIFY